jgi:hypothetical protein
MNGEAVAHEVGHRGARLPRWPEAQTTNTTNTMTVHVERAKGKNHSPPAHHPDLCRVHLRDKDGRPLCPGCRYADEQADPLFSFPNVPQERGVDTGKAKGTQEHRNTETQKPRNTTNTLPSERDVLSAPLLCTQPAAESEFFLVVMEREASGPVPPAAAQFFRPRIRRLVHICSILQQANADRPF